MNPPSQPSIIEAARRDFEREWAAGEIPELESFLPPADDPRFAATLEELIHLDIDFRWLRWVVMRESILFCEEPPPLEAYLQRFPILRQAEVICRLACTEFEARIESGQQLQVDEFVARLATAGLVLDPRDRTVSAGAQEPELVGPQRLKAALERIAAGTDELAATNTLGIKADGTWGEDKARATSASEEIPEETPQPQFGYQVLKRIAAGGMGVVFKARQLGLNRIVALKMIRSGAYASDEEIARFRREATAVAQLQHPNIVQIYDIGMQGESPYFSMEFVEGGTLAEWLTRGQLKVTTAARLLAEISAAVGYAHSLNILHRDLKPGNILLARRPAESAIESQSNAARIEAWMPKITDFGLAKQLNSAESGLTQSEAVLGTPCYMPPEQAAGQLAAVGKPSDVYSLGAILYEMLVGRPPFKADTVLETIRQVCSQEPVPPRRLNAAVPADLETICLKCLAKDPRARYHNALELNADLQRYLDGHPIHARPVGQLERAVRWTRRNPVLCGLATAILAAVLLFGVVLLLNQRASRLSALGQLSQEVERRLTAPAIAASQWDEIYALADRIGSLSAPRGEDVLDRINRTFAQRIEQEIQQPKLTAENLGTIEGAIQALEPRSAGLAASLRKTLAGRLRLTIFDHSFQGDHAAPIQLQHQYLEVTSDGASLNSDAVQRLGRRDSRDVVFAWDSQGNVELEATFSPAWEKSQRLSLLLHATTGKLIRARGYRFELLSPDASRAGLGTLDFAEARVHDQLVSLNLYFDSQKWKTITLPARSLPQGEIRLRARRDGNVLHFQVNDLPPLVHEEFYWSERRNQGQFGISMPSGAILTRLRATRAPGASSPNPLEAGDALYGEGQFEAALAKYEAQYEQSLSPATRDELNYKRALCLKELNRTDEARSLLHPLMIGDGAWSRQAGIQTALIYLDQSRFEEADAVIDSLSIRDDYRDIAVQLTSLTRDHWLQRYRESATLNSLRPNPLCIRNLQRAVDLLVATDAYFNQIVECRIQLIDAYERADQLTQAEGQLNDLLNHPNIESWRVSLVERRARILVRMGKVAEALACIDGALYTSSGAVLSQRKVLLLTRAAFHGSQEQWAQAEEHLQVYFESTAYRDPRAWLLRGLVARRLDGNAEGAQQIWEEGYRETVKEAAAGDYNAILLGLLSQSITKEQFRQGILRNAPYPYKDPPAWQLIAKGVLPESLLTSIGLSVGRRADFLDYLEQMECFKITGEQRTARPARIVAHELFSQMILGSPTHTRPLSKDEDQLLWELTHSLLEAYLREQFKDEYLLNASWAWNGHRGLIGWEGLAQFMDSIPQCRGPLAYVYTCHFENLGKKSEAAQILAAAKRDAPPGSLLEKVIAARFEQTE
jgi:serine/threonine protein kinase